VAKPADPNVQEALEKIEEAQNLISSAAQCLSPVEGLAKEYFATQRLYDAVKKHWYRVANRDAKLRGAPGVLP